MSPERIASVLRQVGFGFDSDHLPPGVVTVLAVEEYAAFAHPASGLEERLRDRVRIMARHPDNALVLAFEVETEHARAAGMVLRNLHGGERRRHLTIPPAEKPVFHNLTPALERAWGQGVLVLVEGPRDARVLHAAGMPAVALLGSAPTHAAVRLVRRYAHTAVFVPDNDLNPSPEVERVRVAGARYAARIGLHWRTVRLRGDVKDPGELDSGDAEMDRLRTIVADAARFGGGGYRGERGDAFVGQRDGS